MQSQRTGLRCVSPSGGHADSGAERRAVALARLGSSQDAGTRVERAEGGEGGQSDPDMIQSRGTGACAGRAA